MARHSGRGRTLVAAAYGVVMLVVVTVCASWAHYSLATAPKMQPPPAAAQPAGVSPPSLQAQVRGWLRVAQPPIHDLFVAGDDAVIDASEGNSGGAGVACQSASAEAARLQQ